MADASGAGAGGHGDRDAGDVVAAAWTRLRSWASPRKERPVSEAFATGPHLMSTV